MTRCVLPRRTVVAPVAAITGLSAEGAEPAVVVDRAEWVRSNTEALRRLVAPLSARDSGGGGLLGPVTTRVAAVQVGLAFGWLSSKVLGQFEVLPGSGEGEQRLLLVAPNIVAAADSMGVDAHDFRLWVCMHEETHRVQFGANPWLSDYFTAEVSAIVADLDISAAEALTRIVSGLRRREAGGVAAWVQSDEMRSRMSGLVALMSLLEGHADWVMDQSADVVPSAAALRVAFEQRRRSAGLFDSVIRRLLGLDAKMAQYRDGAAFVRAVVAAEGVGGFNRIWTSPATLPLASEIHDPPAWIARVRAL